MILDQHVELGKTGIVVPRIGVGAMTWGKKVRMTAYGGTVRPEDEEDAFRASVDAGVTLFDTAEMYGSGNSERRLGELATSTNAIVATKYAPSLPFMPFFPRPSAHLPEALDANLARLGRVSVDLYQIHYPVRFVSIRRQVALRWVIDQGALPIPGAKNGAQARENAGALTFSLSQAELSALSTAASEWIQNTKWRMSPTLSASPVPSGVRP